MFQEKSNQSHPKEAWLYPIYPSTQLLSMLGHKNLLEQIQQLIMSRCKSPNDPDDVSQMIDQYYGVCYDDLFHRYAQFVQCLNEPGLHWEEFMLNRALIRVSATLKMTSGHLPQLAKAYPRLGGVEKILYAIVSATLLYELGRVCENRVIHLCNHKGEFIDIWDPLTGPIDASSNFKVRYEKNWQKSLLGPLTVCYSRSVMPKVGMLWLADSPDLLDWWFKLLLDPEEGYSEFGIKFDFDELARNMARTELESLPVERRASQNMLAGEAFWQWLNDALADGRVRYNQDNAYAHMTSEGLLLDHERAIEEFLLAQGNFTDKAAILKQIRQLGVAEKNGSDLRFSKYLLSYPGTDAQKSATLFGHGHQHDTHRVVNGILIQASSLQHGHHMPQSEHVQATSQVSWVNQFFQRFLDLVNISGFDHTRQP